MADRQASPLGRYDDADDGDQLYDVRLVDLPVKLLAVGRRQHDDLMRELALLSMSQDGLRAVPTTSRPDMPARLVELVETLGVKYGRATRRPDAAVDAALDRGDDRLTVEYRVPAHVVQAADQLEGLMREADDFCRDEQLLTMPRSETVVAFSHWYLEEFRRQIAGLPPTPWPGPFEP